VHGFDRTAAVRDGVLGVIDKAGAWFSPVGDLQIPFAMTFAMIFDPRCLSRHHRCHNSETISGWHFKNGDRWGVLDPGGHVVLDAEFDMPVTPCARTLVAFKNKEWLRFKWDGTPLQPPNGHFVDGGCWAPFTLKIDDKLGLVTADGAPMTPVQFDAVVPAGASAKNVKLGGRWGRIADDGRWLIEPKFDYLSADEWLLVAAVDGKRGFLSLDGSWLIEPRFDAARLVEARISRLHRRPDPDSAFVTISGATGLLRLKDGSWVIPPRPGVMCNILSNNDSATNAIISQTDSKLVVMSPLGETWFEIDADRIGLVRESGLLPFLRYGKWGLVDTAGQVMVEPQFDDLDGFVRGIAWARRGERWCAIDRRGRSVPTIACTAEAPPRVIRPDTDNQIAACLQHPWRSLR